MNESFNARHGGQETEGGSVKAEGLGDGSLVFVGDHRQAALDNATRAGRDPQAKHTRRQLITRVLRNASLALLGIGGGAVVVKRRRLLREGKCINQGICRDCTVFDDCGLPRALSTRSVLARIRHGE
jgi:hypothetical protein